MRVLFLDIDGVLNSYAYDSTRMVEDGNIDVSRLPLVQSIVDQTGARVVLSSTWRSHWDPTGGDTDDVGRALEHLFCEFGISLYDRTPLLDDRRDQEIAAWLQDHPDTESFAVLDDTKFGWGALDPYVVKTDYRIDRGLEERHRDRAIAILSTKKGD